MIMMIWIRFIQHTELQLSTTYCCILSHMLNLGRPLFDSPARCGHEERHKESTHT